MKKIIFLSGFVLLAVGCNRAQTSSQATQNQSSPAKPVQQQPIINNQPQNNPNPMPAQTINNDLKSTLESTYNQLKQALADKNYSALIGLFEPPKQRPFPPESQFAPLYDSLNKTLVDLNSIKFVSARQNGDWAAYYYQKYPNDPKWNDLGIYKFHMVDGKWKLYASFTGNNWSKDEKEKTLQWEIENNAIFKLPNEDGYLEH